MSAILLWPYSVNMNDLFEMSFLFPPQLSDVREGGATVFPDINVRVPAVKAMKLIITVTSDKGGGDQL